MVVSGLIGMVAGAVLVTAGWAILDWVDERRGRRRT